MFSNGLFANFPGLLADAAGESLVVRTPMELLAAHLVAAVVFSLVGIAVLGLSFWLMHKFSPFSVVKELEHDQNTAVAIVMGSVIIGISLIIAAAIQG